MSEIALDVSHVSIDYRDMSRVSLGSLVRNRGLNRADVVRAVNDVSFSVNKSEVVGIVGRNGSGKSTLLKAIAGIFQPDEGTIDTHGNRVSLMSLGVGVDLGNTGRENILTSGLLMGCSYDYIQEKMDEIIEFSELGSFIDRPVRTYSSGMYAKLSFATTAILDMDIMLVDEVLAVGDGKFRNKSLNKMKEMIFSDRTVLIVSHAPEILEQSCDRILWINDSRFVTYGDAKEVLRQYEASMR